MAGLDAGWVSVGGVLIFSGLEPSATTTQQLTDNTTTSFFAQSHFVLLASYRDLKKGVGLFLDHLFLFV